MSIIAVVAAPVSTFWLFKHQPARNETPIPGYTYPSFSNDLNLLFVILPATFSFVYGRHTYTGKCMLRIRKVK